MGTPAESSAGAAPLRAQGAPAGERAWPAPHQVDVTEAVEPEVVQGVGGEGQLPGEEAALALPGGVSQAAQDPGVHGGRGAQLQTEGAAGHRRARLPRPSLSSDSRQPHCQAPPSHLLCRLRREVLP